MKETSFIIKEVMGGAGDVTHFKVIKTVRYDRSSEASVSVIGTYEMEWQARLELIRQIA